MFKKIEEIEAEKVDKGISRRVLATSGKLMMVRVKFEQVEDDGELHSHPHEQVSYIESGKFEVTIGEEKTVLEKGDSFYVESNKPHGVRSLEKNSTILDIFTPKREDILNG